MPRAELTPNPNMEARYPQLRRPLQYILPPVVLLFGLLALLTYLSFIPDYFNKLVSKCVLQDCGLASPAPPTTEAMLSMYGLTVESYAILYVLIDSVFTLLFAAVAFTIFVKGRREPMALLTSLMLVSFGTTFPQLAHTATVGLPFWEHWFSSISVIGWITLFLFFCLFPDGRFVPKWTAIPVAIFTAVKLLFVFFPGSRLDHNYWPLLPGFLLFALPIAALIYSQLYRYRRCPSLELKQQTKWVTYGFTVGLAAFLVIGLMYDPALFPTPLPFVFLNGFLHLFLLIIPITLAFAILRKRLWDVDPLVNRTLVYFSLSACIVALYSFSIVFLGKMFHTEDRFFPSLISTAVVAILFAPLKDRLQRTVNRLMKGRHDDPYGMLSELRNLLSEPVPPEAMLDTIVQFIRKSLRIPYAAVSIEVNQHELLVPPGIDDQAMPGCHTFPIVHRGKEVGTLIAATRPGEPFSSEDRRLIDVLLGHAGPIVDNFIMTRGMKLLADDLQQSREKLVLAREEERRTIRRNLHDELAPRLAALGLNASAAEMYVKRSPEATTELLAELRQVIRTTVEDIRTLVHGMRPASLDEWGLVGAIQQRVRELTVPMQFAGEEEAAAGLKIEFHAPQQLPTLPAAVEVAAYWIVTESIANVVRHAQASFCSIKLEMASPKQLVIEIIDNGVGMDEHRGSSGKGGIGTGSIRERAAELGGQCKIESLPGGGTRVKASLPVTSE